MELKKSFSFQKMIIPLYVVAFLTYLLIGLLPAEATSYATTTKIIIPEINLTSEVTELKLENHTLNTPDTIVGSFSRAENKTLLIGHAKTVFKNLQNLREGDVIIYESMIYHVTSMIVKEKSMISMSELLKAADKETIVIMTCAGESLENGDATHRLIVTAVAE